MISIIGFKILKIFDNVQPKGFVLSENGRFKILKIFDNVQLLQQFLKILY